MANVVYGSLYTGPVPSDLSIRCDSNWRSSGGYGHGVPLFACACGIHFIRIAATRASEYPVRHR